FFSYIQHPPSSTLFPYTTLFRSDPSEVHKNVHVDVPLVGDVKTVVSDLIPLVDEYDHDEWLEEINGWKNEVDSRSIMNWAEDGKDRKSTRLNSSHVKISYAVFCL